MYPAVGGTEGGNFNLYALGGGYYFVVCKAAFDAVPACDAVNCLRHVLSNYISFN